MRDSLNAAGDAAAAGFAPGVAAAADAATDLINTIRGWGTEIGYWLEGTTAAAEEATNRQVAADQQKYRTMSARARREREIARLEAGRLADQQIADAQRVADEKLRIEESARERLRNRLGDATSQVETFGMTPLQREIHDVRRGGGDAGLQGQLIQQLEQLDRLNAQRERSIELQRRDQDLQSRAASIIRENMRPLEEFRSELAEIQELYRAGKLDIVQYARAIERARAHNEQAGTITTTAPRQAPLATIKFGTSDAARAIAESRRGGEAKELKTLTNAAIEGNKIAAQMLDELKNPTNAIVAAHWN
jgi:hypothetical protein